MDVIIGTGNEHLDAMIQEDIKKSGIGHVVAIVPTRRSLVKKINEVSPEMIIIGDDLLGESNNRGESDVEWENIIEDIRRFSYNLRIVFFCDRSEDDLFLAKLTTFNITDIFNEGTFPKDYIQQLNQEPNFKNIIRFRNQVEKATEDMKKKKVEEEIKAAEEIIVSGVRPQEGRVVEKIVPVYQQLIVQPKLIVFASAFEGAGSSSMAKLFAEHLATLNLHVGLVESPYAAPYWYEAIDGEVRVKEDWKSWFSSIDKDQVIRKGSDIEVENVTYIIKGPNDLLEKWSLLKTAYLIGYARQIPIIVYDMSHNLTHEHERVILKQADHIFITSTFDPVRVNRSVDEYSEFRKQIPPEKISMILNYSTKDLRTKYEDKLRDSFSINGDVYHIPYVHEMTTALIKGCSTWEHIPEDDEFKNELKSTMAILTEKVVGKELLSKLLPESKRKRWSFFSKK